MCYKTHTGLGIMVHQCLNITFFFVCCYKMKIAVLISGRLKNRSPTFDAKWYEDSVRYLKSIFKQHTVTYFISINTSAHNDEFLHHFMDDMNVDVECVQVVETVQPEELRKYTNGAQVNQWGKNAYSMFFHTKNAFRLMQDYSKTYNVTFDSVVKFRSEIGSQQELCINDLAPNTVYIPAGSDWGGINDQVAHGDYESMWKYCQCADYVLTLCQSGVNYHPETLLLKYIQTVGLNVVRTNFQYRLTH